MGRAPSLLIRISIRLTIVSIAAIIIAYGWLFYELKYSADRIAEGSLVSQAEDVAGGLSASDGPVTFVLPDYLAKSKTEENGHFRYAISDGVRRLYASRWEPEQLDRIRILDAANQLYQSYHREPDRELYFGAIIRANVGGHPLVIQVERNSRRIETLMDTLLTEFFIHGGWIGVPFLLLLLMISIWTIRGALAPLEALSRDAASIGPTSIDRRLSERAVPSEILPLVRAVNSALDRLDAGFSVQREFTADAAHELRTPLAVLFAHVDTLSDRRLAASLREDLERMNRVVSQLLKVAQLDSSAISSNETAELNEIVLSVARLMIPLAVADGKSVEAQTGRTSCVVQGNQEFIYHAVRNLAENALRHTAPGTSIELVATSDRTIQVIDHGPGIPDDERARVFKRFWRANRSGIGAGLGLAIVKKTMDLHGGTVTISDTPGGGATFILQFPSRMLQQPVPAVEKARAHRSRAEAAE